MLAVARNVLGAPSTVAKRNLASSVLLSRSWENHTVAQLRLETKNRGLSSSGNKASLIQRLKSFEDKKTEQVRAAAAPAPAAKREASTSAAPASASASTVAAMDPDIFNIKIPDLSRPDPEIPVQVPFVPDFWDSAHNAVEPQLEGASPKLLVVAGATTHHGGGPSHNFIPEQQEAAQSTPTPVTVEASKQEVPQAEAVGSGGLFYDMAADLGFLNKVPTPKPARTPFWQLFA